MQFEIRDASKVSSYLTELLHGPSGSGKTYSALLAAIGCAKAEAEIMGHPVSIGCIETEDGAIGDYAHLAEEFGHHESFKVIALDPPYSGERYLAARDALIEYGCGVVVIDSLSHLWSGIGGTLEVVGSLQDDPALKHKGSAWNGPSQEWRRALRDLVEKSPCHLIATARGQSKWDMSGGQMQKVGSAPDLRDGAEFEFRACLGIGMDHFADRRNGKDRSNTFENAHQMTVEDGYKMAMHFRKGRKPEPSIAETRTHIGQALKAHGWPKERIGELIKSLGGVRVEDLSGEMRIQLIEQTQGDYPAEATQAK